MKRVILLVILLLAGSACDRVDVPPQQKTGPQPKSEDQYNKELEDIRDSIREEVRIKVKKDSKGYSWEITGKDTKEVLKANDTLRKRLDN
ncbi:MAG TPA: hypothetical protein VHO84_11055 [Syntrophorhabdaceae bacterium]|nr:hypothetical protein [Syntrophorhabdaceae bacterium]